MNPVAPKRCAVYARVSSDERLDQSFNSIDAQREAGVAYVASQRAEGWIVAGDDYFDPGYSGGNMDRPGLKRLLADVEAGRVDIVVVYKIDRLTRSLADFAKIVDAFDAKGVSFVSVTQQFNTTTSMGRLTLNILLSFAQFEREVTAERIRDKFAASRAKGIFMGGVPPLGYDVQSRKLIVNEAAAANVRYIFQRFSEVGSGTTILRELAQRGITTRQGKPITKGFLYRLLNNRAYLGEAVHKGKSYPGEHDAIIDQDVWDAVRTILKESPRVRANRSRANTPALLKGLLWGADGAALSPTHTRKNGKLYRYYVSQTLLRHGAGSGTVGRVSAAEIEGTVVDQLRAVFRQPEIIVGAWKSGVKHAPAMTEAQARDALTSLDPMWDELFPAEQARIVQLLVDRIIVGSAGLDVRLRVDGLGALVRELQAPELEAAA